MLFNPPSILGHADQQHQRAAYLCFVGDVGHARGRASCRPRSATAGNAWDWSVLATPKTVNNGDAAPSFPASAMSIQIDA